MSAEMAGRGCAEPTVPTAAARSVRVRGHRPFDVQLLGRTVADLMTE